MKKTVLSIFSALICINISVNLCFGSASRDISSQELTSLLNEAGEFDARDENNQKIALPKKEQIVLSRFFDFGRSQQAKLQAPGTRHQAPGLNLLLPTAYCLLPTKDYFASHTKINVPPIRWAFIKRNYALISIQNLMKFPSSQDCRGISLILISSLILTFLVPTYRQDTRLKFEVLRL